MNKFWKWMIKKEYITEEENEVYFFNLDTIKVVYHNLEKEKFKKPMLIGYMIEYINELSNFDEIVLKKLQKLKFQEINYEILKDIIENCTKD